MTVTRRLEQRWHAFWFPAVPVRRLAAFRVLVAGYILFDLLVASRWTVRYADVADEFYAPLFLLRLLPFPRLGPEGMQALYVLLVVAATCALVGVGTRWALWTTAALYLYWYASVYSYGTVQHQGAAVVLALFVLAIAPAGAAYSIVALRARGVGEPSAELDELAGWAMQFLTVVLCCLYVIAAYQKVRLSGLDWWTSGALDEVIVARGTPPARYLAEYSVWLVHGLALAALVFEGCAPLLLLPGRARRWYGVCAVLFALTILALLQINTLGMALVALVVFDLERGAERIDAWARRLSSLATRARGHGEEQRGRAPVKEHPAPAVGEP